MARDLGELRKEIDRENTVILEAFMRRMALSREVAESKRESGKPIFDGTREREILSAIAERTPMEYRRESRALFAHSFVVCSPWSEVKASRVFSKQQRSVFLCPAATNPASPPRQSPPPNP